MKQKRIENRALIQLLKKTPCQVCWTFPVDIDHIRTVGSGGDDVLTNLMPLCRMHHSLKESQGKVWMADTFSPYRQALLQRGWEYDELRKRWTHD